MPYKAQFLRVPWPGPVEQPTTPNVVTYKLRGPAEQCGPRCLSWAKSSRGLSAVAERRWRLARHSVPGTCGKNENVLKG
jgi:hypothetical protein